MTYDFFADEQDKMELLNFIFDNTQLQVFDADSPYGQKITEYKSTDDIRAKFDLQNGRQYSITFKLWMPSFKGKPIFNKVSLDPKYCKGHTFRYATNGWGLIQLYFGGLHKYPGELHQTLNHSHIGHFNEKGALGRDHDNHINGHAKDWDWKAIEQTSRQLKYLLHQKLAVKKDGTRGILKGALQLESQGVVLR